jgi:hypothetical protein
MFVRPQKAQKIDLNTEYPCPCRRKGCLIPITLTEAFGCNRCRKIFVLEDKTQVIEELSSSYHYNKRAWRWTGHRWISAHSGLRQSYLPIALSIILVLTIVWVPLVLHSASGNPMGWAAIALLLAVLPALIFWLAYRH